MTKSRILIGIFTSLLFISCSKNEENLTEEIPPAPTSMFFPENNNNNWETISPEQLNWNENKINDLYTYLEDTKSKGFIILKNGRIAIEKYFNGHSQNELWLWYSSAKTLTAATVGIAQDENYLNINDKTSDYLGNEWTSLEIDKQNLITVKNHLNMTTGLIDNVGQLIKWSCTTPNCLEYETDAGNRWAYHQGAYTLLKDVVTQATGTDFNDYFYTKIRDKIGMNGSWDKQTLLTLYSSDTRSMARWGLLMLNKGVWNKETVLSSSFFTEMTTTSQNINPSYGYLWWLNGKDSYLNTTSQESFTGSLIPDAPADTFAALGANDQKIYVVPSMDLVIIRTGESAGEMQLGLSSFDNELWKKINAVIK